jgi:outer membrane immunogenic protein
MKATLLAAAAFSLMTASVFAADLGVPSAEPAHFTWSGCYAGANVGGGRGQKDLTDTTGFLAGLNGGVGGPGSTSANISGYLLGGQIGCDYQFPSDWVLGVEGYAAGGKISGNTAFIAPAGPGTFHVTTNFLTSGTARIGYAWGRWLPYMKGGVAWAGDNYSVIDAGGAYDAEATEDRFGWTAGAGIEWAMWNDWSVKLEYDYYGFGTRNVTFTDNVSSVIGPVQVKQDIQVVMLGLNFHVFAGQDLAP